MTRVLRTLPLADLRQGEVYGLAMVPASQLWDEAAGVELLTGSRPTMAVFWDVPDADPGQDLPPTERARCL